MTSQSITPQDQIAKLKAHVKSLKLQLSVNRQAHQSIMGYLADARKRVPEDSLQDIIQIHAFAKTMAGAEKATPEGLCKALLHVSNMAQQILDRQPPPQGV